MSPVTQPALLDAPELPVKLEKPDAATVGDRGTSSDDSGVTSMIERLAMNPGVDVAKLERLIAMQERILDRNAEAAFNAAFTRMQPEIPTIIERARTDKTAYAPLEDIIEVIRPIYAKHGFSLGFQTEWPDAKTVKVIGILTHNEGHARRSEFLSAADQTGSKNAIQALGSTVSYGKRYATKDLFCIVTREQDDDGHGSEKVGKPDVFAPAGFDDWWTDMTAVSDEGFGAFSAAWNNSTQEHRAYAMATHRNGLVALKAKAKTVKVNPS